MIDRSLVRGVEVLELLEVVRQYLCNQFQFSVGVMLVAVDGIHSDRRREQLILEPPFERDDSLPQGRGGFRYRVDLQGVELSLYLDFLDCPFF